MVYLLLSIGGLSLLTYFPCMPWLMEGDSFFLALDIIPKQMKKIQTTIRRICIESVELKYFKALHYHCISCLYLAVYTVTCVGFFYLCFHNLCMHFSLYNYSFKSLLSLLFTTLIPICLNIYNSVFTYDITEQFNTHV